MPEATLFWGGVIGLLVLLAAGVGRFRKSPRLATASACLLLLLGVALLGEAAVRLYHWHAFGMPLGASMLLYSDPELGWRGVAVMGDPSSPRPKILVVGDSFTTPDPHFVKAPDMYYSVLGHLLDAEIFAYGSGGYGTLQELMIIDRYLPRVRPDLIVLQVHSNDFINNSWELERTSYFNNNLMKRPYLLDGAVDYKFPTHFSGVCFFMATHSRLAYEVTIGVHRLGAFATQAGYLRSVEKQIWQDGLAYPPFRRAVDITDELIARITRRAAPTPVVVFYAEWDDGGPFYASWRAILRRREVRVCEDVGSSVRAAEVRGEVVRPPDNTHWNVAGHVIAARALAGCLGPQLSHAPRP
jgi:lysophospholipase L1-like esterase